MKYTLYEAYLFIIYNIYISKSLSVVFIVVTLLLSHISVAFQSISVYFNCEIY